MNVDTIPLPPYENLYGIWHTPWWHAPWIFYSSLSLCIMSIIIAACYVIKWYRRRKKVIIPWEAALYQLHTIKLEKFEDRKDFYFELTYILKYYLSARYSCDLNGKTDQEIVEFIANTELPKDLLERLQKIFLDASIIKFAQENIVLLTMEHDLKRAIDIVRNTIPKHT